MSLPAAQPAIIPEPFGQNADPSNIDTIPATTATPGLASYDVGFPAITMQPVVAGGIPPRGQDVNGILFAVTAHLYFLQSGQRWPFSSAVAAAIGGYPVGAIVAMADGTGEWVNVTAANSTNPDTTPPGFQTGGQSGWITLTSVGSVSVAVTGAGPVTLTSLQGKKPFINFTGILTANQSVTFPNMPGEWLVINNTSGAFSLTVNVGGGASQTIPQGSWGAPVGVYSIGDGNMYPSISPFSFPISQGADALTLAQRTNAGNLVANYFNMTGTSDNLAFSQVAVGAGDGWIRWNDLAHFKAAIGNNFPTTGASTAVTQASGNSTTLIATTAFVNPSTNKAVVGHRTNPDGTISQWGSFSTNANAGTVSANFDIPFPNLCTNVSYSMIAASGIGGAGSQQDFLTSVTNSGFALRLVSSASPGITICWEATGY